MDNLKIKNKLYSFLASIVFIPIAALGQFFGSLIGLFLAWFNALFTAFTMPKIFSFITVGFVGGAFAGWLAAKAVLKMNKHIDFRYTVALPILVIALALIGDFYSFSKSFDFYLLVQRLIREGATIVLYIMTIKDDTETI